jgi:hypothetical protein
MLRCRRSANAFDRLPLGLELAAARVATFTTKELLERLERPLPVLVGGARDLPERQRTLRRTVEWSRELLSREDADCFERLAVFRGGWDADAAASLGIAERTLAELVESSLVQRIAERYAMLETIRELAQERFEARADAERLRRRHAMHVRAFAEEARTHARGPDEALWLARTAIELDNIRAALDWCLGRGRGRTRPRDRGRARNRSGTEARGSARDERDSSRCSIWRAGHPPACERGPLRPPVVSHPSSETRAPRGSASTRRCRSPDARGDRECEAWVLHGLGAVAALEGDRSQARRLLEDSLERFLELEQHAPAGGRLSYLAELAREDGDLAAMQSYYERSIEQYRLAGDESGAAGSIEGLAFVAFEEGDLGRAGELFIASAGRKRRPRAGVRARRDRGRRRGETATGRVPRRLLGAVERLESELDAGPIAGMASGLCRGGRHGGRRRPRAEPQTRQVALARELLERGE